MSCNLIPTLFQFCQNLFFGFNFDVGIRKKLLDFIHVLQMQFFYWFSYHSEMVVDKNNFLLKVNSIVNFEHIGVVLVSLLLTLKIFQTLF